MKAGVIGASGYTGSELVRLLSKHPSFNCIQATSRRAAGESLASLYPRRTDELQITLEEPDLERLRRCDLIFLAVPHGTSMDWVPRLDDGQRTIVDLAGDYRISDVDQFETAYQIDHTDRDRLNEFVYGIPELYEEEIRSARFIANPGCYVTSVLLPMIPLVKQDWIEGPVFVDSKSGISGAGRDPSSTTTFMNVNNEIRPYKIGNHRHQTEMTHHLGRSLDLRFVPHIISAERGLESAIYAKLKGEITLKQVRNWVEDWADPQPLLRYRREPVGIKAVARTPFCDLSLTGDDDALIIISTLDNLLKGAASQALQNANLAFDLPMETGLVR